MPISVQPLGACSTSWSRRSAPRGISAIGCVQRGANGRWRPAAAWRGSRAATEGADRALRLQLAERSLRATGPDADRRRRLRLAELTLDPDERRRLRLAAAERELDRR
jgi:hypothetical protein